MADPKKFTNPKLIDLAQYLINEQGGEDAFNPDIIRQGYEGSKLKPHIIDRNVANKAALGAIDDGVTIPQLGQLGIGAIQAHPFKALALGGSAMANLGGLTDDDKFGGQLGGAALGALSTKLLGGNPIVAGMVGGNLGMLFDKLRAQKEQEQSQMQQYNDYR